MSIVLLIPLIAIGVAVYYGITFLCHYYSDKKREKALPC